MIEIAVRYLENVTGAKPWTGNADRVCRGCVIDSRQVETDSIFVAFPGETVDGNAFAPQASEAGAACVVLTRDPTESCLSSPMRMSAPFSYARTLPSSCSAWRRAIARACAARLSP